MSRFRRKYERPDLVTSETFLSIFWVLSGTKVAAAFLTESEAIKHIAQRKNALLTTVMSDIEPDMQVVCDQLVPFVWAKLVKTIETEREYLHAVWTCPICGREDESADVLDQTPQPLLHLCDHDVEPRWADPVLVEWPRVPDLVGDVRRFGI